MIVHMSHMYMHMHMCMYMHAARHTENGNQQTTQTHSQAGTSATMITPSRGSPCS